MNLPNDLYKKEESMVMRGEAPSIAVEGNKVHLSLASGDTIFYSLSSDKAAHFSTPVLVAVLPGLVCAGGRGPQILCSNGQLLIAAPDTTGNFSAYLKKSNGSRWEKAGRINDLPNTAKEGFLSLGSAKGGRLFAVWLDLRNGQKNNVYCARSSDGGKSWLKNQLVYRSPDGSVCDCCKPSVIVQNQRVIIMFRNNVKGNRDLYLIESKDGGATFAAAQKLGQGSWKLNGCPMDGGGLIAGNNKTVRTVWRREGNIYTSEPGKQEAFAGTGRQCAIAGTNEKYYLSFVRNGKVYCRKPDSEIIALGPGGNYPKLAAIGEARVVCAWEMDNKIYAAIVAD